MNSQTLNANSQRITPKTKSAKKRLAIILIIVGICVLLVATGIVYIFLYIFPPTNKAKESIQPFLTYISQHTDTTLICDNDIRSVNLSPNYPSYTAYYDIPASEVDQVIDQAADKAGYSLSAGVAPSIAGPGISGYDTAVEGRSLSVTVFTHDLAYNENFTGAETGLSCGGPGAGSSTHQIATGRAIATISISTPMLKSEIPN